MADPSDDPAIQALAREITDAPDAQILRVLATVDKMSGRGPADALIAPLRQRLLALRPPRPLRFARILFYPLDPLVAPLTNWHPGASSIPRNALTRMADFVCRTMGDEADAIKQEIAGRTNADTRLIARLGQSLWPAAASILRTDAFSGTWQTGFDDMVYQPLAESVAALLDHMIPLDALCAETANGLLPPRPESIAALLGSIAAVHRPAVPMLIALLLVRLPDAAAAMPATTAGLKAMEQATDRLLLHLDQESGTEAKIAAGTLADAGAAAGRIIALLHQFDTGPNKPRRREQMRSVRQKLDACCKARFMLGLQEDLLTPLQNLDPDPDSIGDLETAASGLRILEMAARAVGSGATYDLLLRGATNAIKDTAMRDRLTVMDQVRLVEILAGPETALALLDKPR